MGNDDKLDKELDATFDKLATGEFPILSNSDDVSTPPAQKELEANVTELQTRLSLTEESYGVAVKERDAADEARRKLERTLAEFLTRFASVRETQSLAFKEVEKLTEIRAELEKKLSDMAAELTATQEARVAAQRSRDEALAQLDAQKADVEQARVQLARFQELAVSSLEPLSQEHSRGMKNLIDETESVIEEAYRAREESARQLEKLAAMAADLKAHISAQRREISEHLSSVLGAPAATSGLSDAVPPGSANSGGPGGPSHARSMAALAGHVV